VGWYHTDACQSGSLSASDGWSPSTKKVSVPIPAKCDNLVLGDSKRWRTLERALLERAIAPYKKQESASAKRKRSFSPNKYLRVPLWVKTQCERLSRTAITGAVLGRVFSRNKYLRVPLWVKTQCERLSRTAIANSISPHPLSLIFFFIMRKRGMTGRWVWVKNPELEHGEPQNINRFTLLQ